MAGKLRVLFLEDSEDDARLLLRRLAKDGGYDPSSRRVCSLPALREALEGEEWDIIILDHSMPRFSVLNALQEAQRRGLDIPIIIVSGTIEPEAAVAAMRAGASDYLMKDDLTRLVPAVERELREARSRRDKRLAEEEFRQAQKMESVGRLAGGVAHDFNNILTAIMGYANLLSTGPGDSWREDLEEIRKAAERAASLTRQLLAFSRRQALQLKVVDLNAEIADLEKMLRRMLGEDIRWELSLEPNLGSVKADPGQIQQVLMNLVVNARDAMPHGGVLTISTANVRLAEPRVEADISLPPGDYVTLSVQDTGTGIDEEARARLFEPFFTTKEKGTGLGLAVVYGVVKQSGGLIAVESAPGEGATFRIHFPQVEAPAASRPEEQGPRRSRRGDETVLIVDDDSAVRSVMRRVLRQEGYAVLEAGDGWRAFELAQGAGDKLHLLVTDMVLPDLNGMDLMQRIAVLRPEARVLLISGYLDRDFGNFILDETIPFLQKPFSPSALAEKVREVLDS